ncbi:hypothetical protein N865_11575 [Intrasporangium oryzae NRRL B-24470]|uniref:DUF4386 family protein n=1 Tax=Intrasporangium oryzae NRRL B-24470 TaxID=1386089 RepID=W9G8F6_9MICO|nr:hypothetical protein [Intrasporangium oryzae]EWT01098.1 hypothetical protein N865_11575 [Intrasporangium oryzae NRRL B-24470]
MSHSTTDATTASTATAPSPTDVARADSFRRRVAGCCLVLAPVAFSAAELLAPEAGNDAASVYAGWAGHRAPGLVAAFVGLAATILFLPGFFGLLGPVVGRGRRVGHIAMGTLLYGLVMAHAALTGVNLVFYAATSPSVDRASALRVMDSLMTDAGAAAPLLLGHYVFTLGVLLVGVAVVRSGQFSRWAGWTVVAAVVSDVVVGFLPVDGVVGDLVSGALLVAGFATLGVQLMGRRPAVGDRLAQ